MKFSSIVLLCFILIHASRIVGLKEVQNCALHCASPSILFAPPRLLCLGIVVDWPLLSNRRHTLNIYTALYKMSDVSKQTVTDVVAEINSTDLRSRDETLNVVCNYLNARTTGKVVLKDEVHENGWSFHLLFRLNDQNKIQMQSIRKSMGKALARAKCVASFQSRPCDESQSSMLNQIDSPSDGSQDLRCWTVHERPNFNAEQLSSESVQSAHESVSQGSDSGKIACASSENLRSGSNIFIFAGNCRTGEPSRILHEATEISFSLDLRKKASLALISSAYENSAPRPAYEISAQIFKENLTEGIRLKAKECTIDAVTKSQDSSLCINMACVWKGRMHDYTIRRLVTNIVQMQRRFSFSAGTGIKLQAMTFEGVRLRYLSPPPDGGHRWLQHSLLISEAHAMPLPKFAEELSKTVKMRRQTF